LTLARPEGNAPGGKGLALFYVETRDADGSLNRISVNRLKDKLGTRKVPTAELELEGTAAQLVCGATDGIKNIAPMLNVTRTWNAVSAVSLMRRGLALARDYAKRRVAFGTSLSDKPLHLDTLAGLQAEFEAAFHLTFFIVELLGRSEANEASEHQITLLRILTPVTKLSTARQSVAVLSEIVESLGGAGYVEDTGLAFLLRDAHVLPIWEGTTNVLALDTLRALDGVRGIDVLRIEIALLLQNVQHPDLVQISGCVERTLTRAHAAIDASAQGSATALEASARRLALMLGRSFALALLCRHAQWSLMHEGDTRALAAARRFAANESDLLQALSLDDARLLATER
jgi:acyl-CoA dehydrogenase